MDQYKVTPRKRHDGWNLEGERLSHGFLWYRTEQSAISYAEWNSRTKGCRIEVLNTDGEVARVEEFPPGNFAY